MVLCAHIEHFNKKKPICLGHRERKAACLQGRWYLSGSVLSREAHREKQEEPQEFK